MSVTVEVRNTGKIYPGGTEALKGIDLSIEEGEAGYRCRAGGGE